MVKKLHHVAILTSDIEEMVEYYQETFGCPAPKIVSVDKPDFKLKTAMVPVGSDGASRLQVIQPVEGPGVKELREGGEGTIFELAFEVEDIEEFFDQLRSKGMTPVDLLGRPIESKYLVASSGTRYFYLPKSQTRGTVIEICQIMTNT